MRYFKMFTAQDKQFEDVLLDEMGIEGFGILYRLKQLVYMQCEAPDHKNSLKFSERIWCRKLRISRKKLRFFAKTCEKFGDFVKLISESSKDVYTYEIAFPTITRDSDRYTRKKMYTVCTQSTPRSKEKLKEIKKPPISPSKISGDSLAETSKPKKPKGKRFEYPDDFERCWKHKGWANWDGEDKRGQKLQAYKSWDKLIKDGYEANYIIECIDQYAHSKANSEFIHNMSTVLYPDRKTGRAIFMDYEPKAKNKQSKTNEQIEAEYNGIDSIIGSETDVPQ